MKKIKYNIEKNERFLKMSEPKTFDLLLIYVSLGLSALCFDLQNYGIDLDNFSRVCSAIFIVNIMFIFCWVIHSLIHSIIKKFCASKGVDNVESK